MSDIPKLGKLIDGEEDRDAVHIAIAPVTAGEYLRPGDRVNVIKGVAYCETDATKQGIGIVDPFLPRTYSRIQKGERFWVCLYPGSITSLRHDWTHPAMLAPEEQKKYDQVVEKLEGESRQWMEQFADRELGWTYTRMMDAADSWVENGDIEHLGIDSPSITEEFWRHYDKLRSTRVPDEKREGFFSCAC